jgi:aldose 1-epimerase
MSTNQISRKHFGFTPDGHEAYLYTLTNPGGMEVCITNYGGAVTSLKVPDRKGNLGDVVLGYETLDEYVRHPRFLGALIGRFANRLALGRFTLDDTPYQLVQNNGPNHLHGGIKGFHKVVWDATEEEGTDEVALRLSYLSVDGEEGYPGNLQVNVSYILFRNNELRIEYHATTDKDTIINLTNHSYFNLACSGHILEHQLELNAEQFTPVGPDLIPTGEISDVDQTPLDFRQSTPIGQRINAPFEQLAFVGGYDHNFVLRDSGGMLRLASKVYEPSSGRVLEVLTTQPGLQFYSGNFLDGSLTGKGGAVYQKHAGLCLETQHFPDSPNHPNFPTVVLRPGEEFKQIAVWRFSAE